MCMLVDIGQPMTDFIKRMMQTTDLNGDAAFSTNQTCYCADVIAPPSDLIELVKSDVFDMVRSHIPFTCKRMQHDTAAFTTFAPWLCCAAKFAAHFKGVRAYEDNMDGAAASDILNRLLPEADKHHETAVLIAKEIFTKDPQVQTTSV